MWEMELIKVPLLGFASCVCNCKVGKYGKVLIIISAFHLVEK